MQTPATKESLVSLLKSTICKVTFTKVDGTIREMRCTLKEGTFTPPEKKTDKVREVKEDVVSVWDLDNNAWRSFKVGNVISATVEV